GVLCPFFDRAATNPNIAENGRAAVAHRNAVENLDVLAANAGSAMPDRPVAASPIRGERVEQLRSMQLQFIATHVDVFDARIAAGRIRELHGDLKPEHCYLGQWSVN